MLDAEKFQHQDVTGFKFGKKSLFRPKMFSHIYFVDGLLIDTGHSKMKNTIISMVKDLEVNQMFITHHHEDHTGNILPLQDIFKCQVSSSYECKEIMRQPPKISLAQELLWGNREAYAHLVPVHGQIETKNYNFQVIPIPGHASDMLALYEPNKKWLFSADLYIMSHTTYFIDSENISQLMDSIRLIQKLDYEILFCSHNPKFVGGRAALARKLHNLEDFYHQVSQLHTQGLSATQIFRKLKLKEDWPLKLLTGGTLSKLNMVKSVIGNMKL